MAEHSSDHAPRPRNSPDARDRALPAATDPEPRSRGDRWTVGELLEWTTERFTQAGLESPRTDAEHLLAHALGTTRVELYLRHARLLSAAERAPFRELVRRRLAREPVAYIEGRRGFHALGLELVVDRRVLIPRPETEHLVDWLLEDLPPRPAPPSCVVDVGTGSGAIALAIKHARPDVSVVGVDISEDALAVARTNAQRLGLDVALVHGDLLAGLAESGSVPRSGFTAIAANLPYVAAADFEGLAPEVRCHEPTLALFGGLTGLEIIERIVDQALLPGMLAPCGRIYLEVGIGQAIAVTDRLRAVGMRDVAVRADYSGVSRIVCGRLAG